MEANGSLIVEHFIAPSPHGANELHRPNAIVGNQDLLNDPLAVVTVDKLTGSGHLLRGRGRNELKPYTRAAVQELSSGPHPSLDQLICSSGQDASFLHRLFPGYEDPLPNAADTSR